MAPEGNEGAHEEEPIQRRPDGQDPARRRPGVGADVAKKHGVSEVTIYAWCKRFGKLEPADVQRLRHLDLRHLEQENAKLKKLVAERDLEIEVMKEVAAKKVGAPVRRRQVAYVCERGLSIRRACALFSMARSALRYESRLEKRDEPVVEAMCELTARYPRYGYRRILVFLERRGFRMSLRSEARTRRIRP